MQSALPPQPKRCLEFSSSSFYRAGVTGATKPLKHYGLRSSNHFPQVYYDVIIVGGSLGGAAAAFSASTGANSVCLFEESGWIGG
ncbi:MAG: FAD-dependent oxidoreductase, partial [Candidatus Eremiobacteraeota bacterium]|nr:FAD-dependent oxidoreductase [Candidatus Eremiobacteraeota bacterium]